MSAPLHTVANDPEVAALVSAPMLDKARRGNEWLTAPVGFAEAECDDEVELIRADSISPTPIRWLWADWLAQGKLHVLAGAPGTGKTTLAITLGAAVTRGRPFPDGKASAPGNVILWSGEDDPADTLVPRFLAAGADMEKVFIVGDVTLADGRRVFDPARDVALLEAKLLGIGRNSLLIVDPIVNAVSGDSHKNTEVRRALAPLVDLAQRHGVAVLGISHFTKGTAGREPTERVTGSLAFGALARVVLVAAKGTPTDDDAEPPRILARAKSNIGPEAGGFSYTLSQVSVATAKGSVVAIAVVWRAPVEGSARELLAAAEPDLDDDVGGAAREAADFLRDLLADGPVSTPEIQKAVKAAGHSWRTVKRAKAALGIISAKGGMKGGWRWSIPEGGHDSAKSTNTNCQAPFGKFGTLRDDDDLEPLE